MTTIGRNADKRDELLDRILESPMAHQVLEDHARAAAARRVELATQLAAIHKDADQRSAELAKALERDSKLVDRAKQQLRAADEQMEVSVRQVMSEPSRLGALIAPIEKELAGLAPGSIDEFLEACSEVRAKVYRVDPIEVTIGGIYSLTKDLAAKRALLERLADQARALKLAPLSDAEIETQLALLTAQLPDTATTRADLLGEYRDGHRVN